MEILEIISDWSDEQLKNLSRTLELSDDKCDLEAICDRIKWLYHSKARETLRAGFRHSADLVKRTSHSDTSVGSRDHELKTPTYEQLVQGLAKNLGVFHDDASLKDNEVYISHAIIIEALNKMKPPERRQFFEKQIDYSEIADSDAGFSSGLRGPLTTIAAISAANSAGFSLYLASTTALGFVTHAVGITLPFAVYTGMTSTIAFVIGPVGWMAAGSWLFIRATGPNWKKLRPAILYLINTRAAEDVHIPLVQAESVIDDDRTTCAPLPAIKPNKNGEADETDETNEADETDESDEPHGTNELSLLPRSIVTRSADEIGVGEHVFGKGAKLEESDYRPESNPLESSRNSTAGVYFAKFLYVFMIGVILLVGLNYFSIAVSSSNNTITRAACVSRGVIYYTFTRATPDPYRSISVSKAVRSECEESGDSAFWFHEQ